MIIFRHYLLIQTNRKQPPEGAVFANPYKDTSIFLFISQAFRSNDYAELYDLLT